MENMIALELTADNIDVWAKAKIAEVARWIDTEFNMSDFSSSLYVVASLGTRRSCSWGGVKFCKKSRRCIPRISLGLHYFRFNTSFREYKAFRKHPIIGSISNDHAATVTALIVHELAHAIDHYRRYSESDPRAAVAYISASRHVSDMSDKFHPDGHGIEWQTIYAAMRERFVNHAVTNPIVEEAVVAPKKTYKPRDMTGKVVSHKVRGAHDGRIAYLVDGIVVAIGIKDGSYGFSIYNRFGTPVMMLDDGRKARGWIKKNLVD
jgi:hypothetical protein